MQLSKVHADILLGYQIDNEYICADCAREDRDGLLPAAYERGVTPVYVWDDITADPCCSRCSYVFLQSWNKRLRSRLLPLDPAGRYCGIWASAGESEPDRVYVWDRSDRPTAYGAPLFVRWFYTEREAVDWACGQ